MMQETMEKRTNRTVGKSRQKDFFAVLLFFFLLPYTCSSVVRAGQEKTVETIVPVSGRTVRMQSGSDVRTMTEEAFLIGALAAVIPAEYEPEALKAQAVILRSSCVAGGHLEETVLENGTTGAAQESISQNSVSAVEPRIIDSNSGFSYLDKAQRKRLWGEQADVLEERCREAVRASSGYVLEWQGAAVSSPFFPSTETLTSLRDSGFFDSLIRAIASSLIFCNLSFMLKLLFYYIDLSDGSGTFLVSYTIKKLRPSKGTKLIIRGTTLLSGYAGHS